MLPPGCKNDGDRTVNEIRSPSPWGVLLGAANGDGALVLRRAASEEVAGERPVAVEHVGAGDLILRVVEGSAHHQLDAIGPNFQAVGGHLEVADLAGDPSVGLVVLE